ncbi:MAG: PAS domain S-box protein [Deltaproteobacteria bacterium]|nr:PAS domain S-box protein [Deltaproteobacteria bacterium]
MNPVVAVDIILLAASLLTLIILLRPVNRRFLLKARAVFVGGVIFTLSYGLCLLLGGPGANDTIESTEDLIGAMIPVWWAFVFYFFLQEIDSNDLRQKDEHFRRLFEQSNDAILIHKQGRILDVNQRACDLLGYDKGKLLTMEIRDLHPEDEHHSAMERIALVEKGLFLFFETRLKRADGGVVDVEVSSSLINAGDKTIQGIVRDITERKLYEERKRTRQDQIHLMEKMEAAGTMAAGIAHNFNNILMGIQGNVSMILLQKDNGHPEYERLKTIEGLTERASELTGLILDMAEGGSRKLGRADLNHIVEATSNTFRADQEKVTIKRELAGDLLPVEVDRRQIWKCLMALYRNCAEAMPEGGTIELRTTNVTREDMGQIAREMVPQGEYVRLTISDTGIGMDKPEKDRIFDPFFTTKGLARATGLSLSSVYGTVRAHGGYIWVDSEKGVGTTFEIYLPAISHEITERKAHMGEKGEEPRDSKTVLLIDDEEMIISLGREMLEKLGYRAITAKSGRDGIRLYETRKEEIALVILDLIMPDTAGIEVYEAIMEINPDAKVLFSSGYVLEGVLEEMLEKSKAGFIQKPYGLEELSKKVDHIMENG